MRQEPLSGRGVEKRRPVYSQSSAHQTAQQGSSQRVSGGAISHCDLAREQPPAEAQREIKKIQQLTVQHSQKTTHRTDARGQAVQ